jgi:hypothetical protein
MSAISMRRQLDIFEIFDLSADIKKSDRHTSLANGKILLERAFVHKQVCAK